MQSKPPFDVSRRAMQQKGMKFFMTSMYQLLELFPRSVSSRPLFILPIISSSITFLNRWRFKDAAVRIPILSALGTNPKPHILYPNYHYRHIPHPPTQYPIILTHPVLEQAKTALHSTTTP